MTKYKNNSDNRVHKLWDKCKFVVISPPPPPPPPEINVVNLRMGQEGQVSAKQTYARARRDKYQPSNIDYRGRGFHQRSACYLSQTIMHTIVDSKNELTRCQYLAVQKIQLWQMDIPFERECIEKSKC